MITLDQLASVCTKAPRATLLHFVEPLNDVFSKPLLQLDTPARQAMFLAQAAHESGEFLAMTEDMNYRTPDRIVAVFPRYFASIEDARPFVGKPVDLAVRVYGGRMGNRPAPFPDGWDYRARGIFGVTGVNNYRAFSLALFNNPQTLLDSPDMLADPDCAVLAAAWYWNENKLAPLADQGNLDAVSDLVNIGRVTARLGDANGYQERAHYLRGFQSVLQARA